MMADDLALQGPHPHLANGSRGRSNLLPYQPHGFTGLWAQPTCLNAVNSQEAWRSPWTTKSQPYVWRAGMPASGSGTQAPALVLRMLREVVHLHRGDEEASRERFMCEQQEAFDAAAQTRASTHRAGRDRGISLRAELNHTGRATPQPLPTTGAGLLQLPFEKCGVTTASRGCQH